MTFRDDREAQLQRAAALERENEELREQLAEREAKAAAELEARERENARLRTELAAKTVKAANAAEAAKPASTAEAAKTPKTAEAANAARRDARVGRANHDAKAGEAPEHDARTSWGRAARPRHASEERSHPAGGFWAGALAPWRILACLALGFAIPAVINRGFDGWLYVVVMIGTPLVAALVLLVASSLAPTRAVAAGVVGVVLGIATIVCLLAPNIVAQQLGQLEWNDVRWRLLALYVTVALLYITRAVRFADLPIWMVPFLVVMFLPTPVALMAIPACGHWSTELAKRS